MAVDWSGGCWSLRTSFPTPGQSIQALTYIVIRERLGGCRAPSWEYINMFSCMQTGTLSRNLSTAKLWAP